MRDPDQIILTGLRPFSPLTDTQWSIIVQEVEKAGDINKVTGTVKQEIAFAKQRFQSLKAAPLAGGTTGKPAPKKKKQIIYSDGRRFSRAMMPLGPDPSKYSTAEYDLVNPDGTPYKVKKDAEVVEKHPGHTDQSSHGQPAKGGGGGGGASGGRDPGLSRWQSATPEQAPQSGKKPGGGSSKEPDSLDGQLDSVIAETDHKGAAGNLTGQARHEAVANAMFETTMSGSGKHDKLIGRSTDDAGTLRFASQAAARAGYPGDADQFVDNNF